VVCAAGLGVAKFALGGSDDSVQRYPAAVETNFLHGCTSNGADMDMCRCSLNSIERQYDLGSFMVAEQRYQATGVLPEKMTVAAADCIGIANQKFNDSGKKLQQAGS
jgi:hypothetical protein